MSPRALSVALLVVLIGAAPAAAHPPCVVAPGFFPAVAVRAPIVVRPLPVVWYRPTGLSFAAWGFGPAYSYRASFWSFGGFGNTFLRTSTWTAWPTVYPPVFPRYRVFGVGWAPLAARGATPLGLPYASRRPQALDAGLLVRDFRKEAEVAPAGLARGTLRRDEPAMQAHRAEPAANGIETAWSAPNASGVDQPPVAEVAAKLSEKGRRALAQGKHGQAKFYFQMALEESEGAERLEVLADLRRANASPAAAIAARPGSDPK